MAVEITIDVFSGRPNPSWILTPDEEAELASRIALATPVQPTQNLRENERLGYRGLIVNRGQSEQTLKISEGAVSQAGGNLRADPGRELEKWLLSVALSHGHEIARELSQSL